MTHHNNKHGIPIRLKSVLIISYKQQNSSAVEVLSKVINSIAPKHPKMLGWICGLIVFEEDAEYQVGV